MFVENLTANILVKYSSFKYTTRMS